jgi:hypothetical protein
MNEVENTSNAVCYAPSSEPFTFYIRRDKYLINTLENIIPHTT